MSGLLSSCDSPAPAAAFRMRCTALTAFVRELCENIIAVVERTKECQALMSFPGLVLTSILYVFMYLLKFRSESITLPTWTWILVFSHRDSTQTFTYYLLPSSLAPTIIFQTCLYLTFEKIVAHPGIESGNVFDD